MFLLTFLNRKYKELHTNGYLGMEFKQLKQIQTYLTITLITKMLIHTSCMFLAVVNMNLNEICFREEFNDSERPKPHIFTNSTKVHQTNANSYIRNC